MCTICQYRVAVFESVDLCSECLRCLFPARSPLVPAHETHRSLSLLPGGGGDAL